MMVRKKISTLVFPFLIFLLAILQYSNTMDHDFAWDDKLVITGNEYTQQGIHGIPEIFSKRVSVPYKNVYRPFPQAMFAVEYDLFRQSPHAMHFFNIFWYALACVAVYWFFLFVFPGNSTLFHFLATLLFTIHPLHVEVVANIKSRDEILTLLFGLCTVILLVKVIEEKKWMWLIPASLCFVVAVLSKENAVTLLPVAAFIVWYRSEKFQIEWNLVLAVVVVLLFIGFFFQKLIVVILCGLILVTYAWIQQKGRWLSLLAVSGLIAAYWLGQQGVVTEESGIARLDSTVLNNIFLWTTESDKVIPTSLVNIGRYIVLFLYPHPLIHLYGYNQIPLSGWSAPETWAVAGIIVLALYMGLKRWKQKTPGVFGVIFFAITYSIYSNFFVLAPDTMADRYMFMPSVGLVLIAMESVFWLAGLDLRRPVFTGIRSWGIISLFAILSGGYFIRTWIGNQDWKNDTTLIYHRIKYMKNNAAAQATYGFVLHKESETAPTKEQQRSLRAQAMKAFTRAVEIFPDFYWAWISIGKIFAAETMNEKAELAFLKAQQIEPISAEGYYCLGTLYYTLGDGELAITYLEKAVLLEPDVERGYIMLGKAYLLNNNIDNLGALAQTAIAWFPHNSEFYAMMASYFYRKGGYKEAGTYAKTALAKNPQNIIALTVLSSLPPLPYGDSTNTFTTPAP